MAILSLGCKAPPPHITSLSVRFLEKEGRPLQTPEARTSAQATTNRCLKYILQGELHDARISGRTNQAKRACVTGRAGVQRAETIQQVKCFSSNFESLTLFETKD